jgi:hypothetical protein
MSRPETGPMQFGDDWPGVFIRGDNALHYALELHGAIKALRKVDYSPFQLGVLEGLLGTLQASDVRGGATDIQILRPFPHCLPPPKEEDPLTEEDVSIYAGRVGFRFGPRTEEDMEKDRPDMLWWSEGPDGQRVWHATLDAAYGFLKMKAGENEGA